MRTGQYKAVLVDDNIEPYETVGLSSLLNNENLRKVKSYQIFNPPGDYTELFPEDYAVAQIKVTEVTESSVTHRKHKNLDVIIAQFGPEDFPHLFNVAVKEYRIVERLKTVQHSNGHALCNPLPKIVI
jgi:hypothetical protein